MKTKTDNTFVGTDEQKIMNAKIDFKNKIYGNKYNFPDGFSFMRGNSMRTYENALKIATEIINSNRVAYWFGGKGQVANYELYQQLKHQYPSMFTPDRSERIADDIKNKKRVFDCSGYVCWVYGINNLGTEQLFASPMFRHVDISKKPKNLAILYRHNHVGLYVDGYVWQLKGFWYGATKDEKYDPSKWTCILEYSAFDYSKHKYDSDNLVDSNVIYHLACDVIDGKYGNGETREKNINALNARYGCHSMYQVVQPVVNEIMKYTDIQYIKIAKEVIAGKYGNGTERTELLSKAGYTQYQIMRIQNFVNKILSK